MKLDEGGRGPFYTKLPRVPVRRDRIGFLVERSRGKKVLHLGCANEKMVERKIREGTLTHFRLVKAAREVWGVDLHAEALERLRTHGVGNLVQGNVETIDQIPELKGRDFEVILAPEIVEHLDNPGLFLQAVRALFGPRTEMIVTVPNASGITFLGHMLRGWEFVHPEHNFFFTLRTMSTMLGRAGFEIAEVSTYSFVDTEVSVIGIAAAKIGRALGSSGPGPAPQGSGSKADPPGTDPGPRRGAFARVRDGLGELAGIMVRRLVFRLNPFFADGLIFLVRKGPAE